MSATVNEMTPAHGLMKLNEPLAELTKDRTATKSKGYWGGALFELRAATTIADCEKEAKARGFNAYVVRDNNHAREWKNTCAGIGTDWVVSVPPYDNNMYKQY